MSLIDSCNFDSVADFRNAEFGDTVWFNSTQFKSNSIFSYAKFNTAVYFDSVHFNHYVWFNGIRLTDNTELSFYKSILPDTLDFSFIRKIPNEIDLAVADFSGRDVIHHINLYKSDISKFHLDYIHFRLVIPDSMDNKRVSNDEIEAMYEAPPAQLRRTRSNRKLQATGHRISGI